MVNRAAALRGANPRRRITTRCRCPRSPCPTGFAAARDAARRAWLIAGGGRAGAGIGRGADRADFPDGRRRPPPLSDGAPNLWAIVQALPWIGDLPLAGLAMAMAIGAAAWLAAYFSARPPRGEALLPAALLIALVLPGLLPQMQPRQQLPARRHAERRAGDPAARTADRSRSSSVG